MCAFIEEQFEVIETATGEKTILTRRRPVVGGVTMLAPDARTPDGALVTKYDGGVYRTDDGREFREVAEQ